MICAKCGTEYEGSQCPKCQGPVITVNNSDYMARRKAYEERQTRIREKEAEHNNRVNGINNVPDSSKGTKDNANKKVNTKKSKNYDEGVFDITKVDLNQVTDKIKSGKDKLAGSKDKIINSRDKLFESRDKLVKAVDEKKQQIAGNKTLKYTKVGIMAAAFLILIAVVVVIISVVSKRNNHIYISDGNKLYDVSSIDSKYVCNKADAVFTSDEVTFYTPQWPQDIDKDKVVSKAASEEGNYYVADVFDSVSGNYSLYIWSGDVCVQVVENSYEHSIYYISDKGIVIYEETETINDNGKTGNKMLSIAEVKKNKEAELIYNVTTIERNLKSAYVYSDKDIAIILNDEGRLYQYDYVRKTTTEVDMYVDSLSTLSYSTNMYTSGAEHVNPSDEADYYMYSASNENYYVEVKSAKSTSLKGVTGNNNIYIYDSKNDYIYWINNKKISYARFKNGVVTDIAVLENAGNNIDVVYLAASGQLVYINDASQLIKAEKGKKTYITENVRDGSLSLVNNTDEAFTYISDGRQYYLKNISANPVVMYEVGEAVNTSATCMYKNRLFFYGGDGQLYSCNLKGESLNNIGSVERFFVGNKLK